MKKNYNKYVESKLAFDSTHYFKHRQSKEIEFLLKIYRLRLDECPLLSVHPKKKQSINTRGAQRNKEDYLVKFARVCTFLII